MFALTPTVLLQPRGPSFQDAKLQFADVQLALKEASGTVVFNSAGKMHSWNPSEGILPPFRQLFSIRVAAVSITIDAIREGVSFDIADTNDTELLQGFCHRRQ